MGPQIILLFLQLGILLVCIMGLGLLRNARENAFITLSAVVESRSSQIEKYLGNISINASTALSFIENQMFETLSEAKRDSASEVLSSNQLQERFLQNSMPYLISALQYTNASGAFIILNTGSDMGSGEKAALYLRDTQPEVQNKNSSDILLLRGPYTIARSYSIPIDSEWSYNQSFSSDIDNNFFTQPIRAASSKTVNRTENELGYWSNVFTLSKTSGNIITYTLPLRDQQGVPYGVFGFEINQDLLTLKLPSEELPFDNAVYILYKTDSNKNAIPTGSIASGSFASRLADGGETLQIQPAGTPLPGVIDVSTSRVSMLGIQKALEIYSPNSYFSGERWELAGLVQQNEIYNVWYFTIQVLAIAFAVSLAIGIAGIIGAGAVFSRPITALAKKVRAANPKEPVQLGKTGISEIDDLTEALEKMSSDVAQAASRLSTTIGLVGLPLGGFETDLENGVVTLTDSMYDLLHLQKGNPSAKTITLQNWQALIQGILNDKEEGFEDVYRYNPTLQNVCWLRIKQIQISKGTELGVVMDVSDEVIHQRQIEFERDYDRETGFLKRNAFLAKCREAIEANPSKEGLMVVSDFYFFNTIHTQMGANLEAESLHQSVEMFSLFRQYGGIAARISDTVFVLYIHDISFDPDIQNMIHEQFSQHFTMHSPEGSLRRFPLSAGICRYPLDAKSVEDLLIFADFAQSEAFRKPQKGVCFFSRELYCQSEIMVQKTLAIQQILQSERLLIALNPIVQASEGNILGYDVLIDYQDPFIKKNEDATAFARMNNRLFELERLTLTSTLSFLEDNKSAVGSNKFFCTSLTNEVVPQEEIFKLDALYSDLYTNMVMNLTDSEHCDKQIFILKSKELKKRGIHIAIDKYGTEIAGNLLFWDLNPDYLRIDPSIISDVDIDPNRHQLLQAILSYTTTRSIKTIATGIRSKGELETLIKLGIDYVQGPYLSGPLSDILPEKSPAALSIQQKIKEAYTYKFILSDSEERFSRLQEYLPQNFQLTEREKVILNQICRGELNNIISQDLNISANTLKTHIRNIYSKFNVKNRRELLALSDLSPKPESDLSLREKEILRLIVSGKTNQEIVNTLCISNNTVRVHIWNICAKLGVKNRGELQNINL